MSQLANSWTDCGHIKNWIFTPTDRWESQVYDGKIVEDDMLGRIHLYLGYEPLFIRIPECVCQVSGHTQKVNNIY